MPEVAETRALLGAPAHSQVHKLTVRLHQLAELIVLFLTFIKMPLMR